MPSKRNVEDDILDATRTCVEAFGVRRTTLTDVARRAGVSRPTVYRRWPDVTALVADLLTRELRTLLLDEETAAKDDLLGENTRVRLVRDRKSTRLNSSHVASSYAAICLKTQKRPTRT